MTNNEAIEKFNGIEDGWFLTNSNTYNNALVVERLDELMVYEDDTKASYAASEAGVPFIYKEGIEPYLYVDTDENRQLLGLPVYDMTVLNDGIIQKDILEGLKLQANYIFIDAEKEFLPLYVEQADAILSVFSYLGEKNLIEYYMYEASDKNDFLKELESHDISPYLRLGEAEDIKTLIHEELLEHFMEPDCETSEYQAEAKAYLHLMQVFEPEGFENALENYNKKVREENRPDCQHDLKGDFTPESKRYLELYASLYNYEKETPAIDAEIAKKMRQENYSSERITNAIEANSPMTVDGNKNYAVDIVKGKAPAQISR